MFESIELDARRSGRRRVALLVSIVFHTVVLGALIIVPLIFVNALPQMQLLSYLITPPPPPAPLPPPPPPPPSRPVVSQPNLPVSQFVAPAQIPSAIPTPPIEEPIFEASDFPSDTTSGAVGGVAGGIVGGVSGGIVGEVPAALLEAPAKALPPPPKPQAPVYVTASVEQAKLIREVQPVYPKLAKAARVTGNVELQVIVSAEGDVTNIDVESGNALLVQAAVNAVKQWKYLPTILDGQRVPVIALVTVKFSLS